MKGFVSLLMVMVLAVSAWARHNPATPDTVWVQADTTIMPTANATFATAHNAASGTLSGALTGTLQGTGNAIGFIDSTNGSNYIFRHLLVSDTFNQNANGTNSGYLFTEATTNQIDSIVLRVKAYAGVHSADSLTGKVYATVLLSNTNVPILSALTFSASQVNDFRTFLWHADSAAWDTVRGTTSTDTAWMEFRSRTGTRLVAAADTTVSKTSWTAGTVYSIGATLHSSNDFLADTGSTANSGRDFFLRFLDSHSASPPYFLVYWSDETTPTAKSIVVDLTRDNSNPATVVRDTCDADGLTRYKISLAPYSNITGISIECVLDSIWGDQQKQIATYVPWANRTWRGYAYNSSGTASAIQTFFALDSIPTGSLPISIVWRTSTGGIEDSLNVTDSAGVQQLWIAQIPDANIGSDATLDEFNPIACNWLDLYFKGAVGGGRYVRTLAITPRRHQ